MAIKFNAKGNIIKELRNPKNTHKYSYSNLIEEINNQLHNQNIPFSHSNTNGVSREKFNTHDLNEFIKFYDMKENQRFSYKHVIGHRSQYSYSLETANFIVGEIKKKPKEIITKNKIANKKR